MKATFPVLLLVTLAACANTPEPKAKLDPKEAEALAHALDGKVPGKPVACVSAMRGSDLRAIGDHTLIYRFSSKLVYRNDLEGTCHGLSWGDTLVMRVTGSQYCRGDIAHVVDLPSGMMTGSCALGDFIPYTPDPNAKDAKKDK